MSPAPRRLTVALGLLVTTGVLAVSAAGAAQARPVPGHDAVGAATVAAPPVAAPRTPAAAPVVRARGVAVPGLVCDMVSGLQLCSHGDDEHLGEASTAQGGPSSSSSTSSTKIGCYSGGPLVQAVYARPVEAPDRYSSTLASFRGWAGAVEKTVDDSARKTKGARHVRFASVASGQSCTLSVLRVTLPAKAFASFNDTVGALRDLGLDKVDVKYLVWADAKGYCGIASTYADDSAAADNANNGRYPSYARIDRS